MYTIGRLARRAKVNADSIRFYERQGLLAPTTKTDSGYRLYPDDALRRIVFIKHAQRCGFSLSDIGELLRMHSTDGSVRGDAYRLAAEKQTEIRRTIDSLQAMSAALESVLGSSATTTRADGATQPGESPLIAALEGQLCDARDGALARAPLNGEHERLAAPNCVPLALRTSA